MLVVFLKTFPFPEMNIHLRYWWAW